MLEIMFLTYFLYQYASKHPRRGVLAGWIGTGSLVLLAFAGLFAGWYCWPTR